MAASDLLHETIQAIYAAGLDEALWPAALSSAARLCGGQSAMLEVFAPPSQRPQRFESFNIPPASQLDYFEHYAALSPRAAYAFRHPAETTLWDYKFIDEREMDRDPYYAKLLARADVRYFLSAKFIHSPEVVAALSVQRTRRQGHVGNAEIASMNRLAPHLRQAFDVAARMRRANTAEHALTHALDWLTDGAALLRDDGCIVRLNERFRQIVERDDSLRIAKGRLMFRDREAQARFSDALAAIARLRAGDARAVAVDFLAARGSDNPAYVVALRPVDACGGGTNREAAAAVFVSDPLYRDEDAGRFLRDRFGLTPAETALAIALQAGISPAHYARDHRLSPNTVYTHLRRVKDKTGWNRTAELIRRLNQIRLPLRRG